MKTTEFSITSGSDVQIDQDSCTPADWFLNRIVRQSSVRSKPAFWSGPAGRSPPWPSWPRPCWSRQRSRACPSASVQTGQTARKHRSEGARHACRGPDGHRRALLAGRGGTVRCGRSKAPAKICAPLRGPRRLRQDGGRASALYPPDTTLDLKPCSSATRRCAGRPPQWWRSFSVIAGVGDGQV